MGKLKSQASWISDSFALQKDSNGRELFAISGVSIEEIAKKIPPPFYVYDASTIRCQYESLRDALSPHGIKIYYSVKANPSLAIIDGLYRLGAGLEVASLGELIAAKKVGADPKNISFAGPVKIAEELEFALDFGIDTINAESEEELHRINDIAGKKGIIQKVGIRVNPPMEVEGAGVTMGGGPKKFGIDEEQLDKNFIDRVRSLPNIDLAGMHVFAASQILSTDAFLINIRNICEIAEKLNKHFPIRYINFGGGLGIPYGENEVPLSLKEISGRLGEIMQQFSFIKNNNIELFIEPGRFFVGPSGIYVVRVDNIKISRGKQIILVDGGIQHMLRPALPVGQNNHAVYNLSNVGKENGQVVDVGGSLCTTLDFLGTDILLPKTNPGDLLGIFSAGAHGWSESMPYYLSHQTAPEILVGKNKFFLVRESIHPKEYLKNQSIPKENIF